MNGSNTITTRVPEETKEILREEAERRNVTVSELVKELLNNGVRNGKLDVLPKSPGDMVIKDGEHACPFCGEVADWNIRKKDVPFLFGDTTKNCPVCGKVVYILGKKGWRKRKLEE